MIHPNITRAQYEALPGINWSRLKRGHGRSGAHIRSVQDRADTPAFKFGRAFHQMVLEPDLFASVWEYVPGKTTTKPGCLTEDDQRKLGGMFDAWSALGMSPTHQEAAITWTYGGVDCKGRIDCLIDGYLADLKSTLNAAPGAFRKECMNLLYHGQMAWLMEGLAQNGMDLRGAKLIAIEKDEPFSSAVHVLSPTWIEIGRALFEDLLEKYTDTSPPAYGEAELEAPEWAIPEITETAEGISL